MSEQNGITPTHMKQGSNQSPPVAVMAALLLRIEEHERTGLTRRCAVLAASSELGIDPAVVLIRARETTT